MPALRPPLKLALLGAFWIIFLLGQFTHVPIAGFSGFLLLGAAAALSCFAAFGWGAWPVHFLLWRVARAEILLFSVGLGWGILSLWMIVLGLCHGWTPAGAYALMAVGTALGVSFLTSPRWKSGPSPLAWHVKGCLTDDWAPTRHRAGERLPWCVAFVGVTSAAKAALIFSAVILGTLLALAPPTYYDSLVYHLALPAAYIRAGHWIGRPDLIYSAFPQNLEMLWTLGLLTGLPSMPGVIGWMLALLLLAAVHRWCRRYIDAATGATAVAFLLSMPAFLLLSSGGYVDIGLALYFFLSIYALSLGTALDSGFILLAGIFAGLATGIKYTGALSIGLGMLWILCDARAPLARRRRSAFLFGVAALAVFAPWLLKNIHYVGNPVFPFFCEWGKAALNPWIKEGAQGYFRALVEYQPHSPLELPALLWAMAVNGFQFGRGADVLGDFGWALLMAFLPLMAWAKVKNRMLGKLGIYAFLFFIAWGLTRPVLRFLLPVAPLLAILAAYGWTQGLAAGEKWLRLCAQGVLALLLLSNALVFFQLADVFKPFRVPLGLETKDAYLTEKLTYYGAASFINKTADRNAEILVVGDQRSYYYERKVTVWTVFNQNPIVAWADQAATPAALRLELRRQGSLLVVNRAEMKRLTAYHALDFSQAGEKNWEGLLHEAPRIYRDNFCDVYTLS